MWTINKKILIDSRFKDNQVNRKIVLNRIFDLTDLGLLKPIINKFYTF